MDKNNLLIVVTLISLFITLILVVFLVTLKTKHKLSNSLFALFLIITSCDIAEPVFSNLVDGPSNLGMLRSIFAFLQIPVFYLYVVSVCYSDFRLQPKHLLHVLPFLVVNAIFTPRFYAVDLTSKIDFITNRLDMIELKFTHIFFHIQVAVYMVAIFLLLKKAKKLYLENYSGTSINTYNWLFQFTFILSFLYLITLLKNIFKFSDYPYISENIKVGLLQVQLFIICWYLYKALNNPELFRKIDSKLMLVSDIIQENETIEKQPIIDIELNSEIIKLKNYMVEKKPFLDPTITIQDISKNLEIPTRELSVLINHTLGQHFFDFVNSYRIENAMTILNDPTKNKVTILEILYEVGFNSKSSFNTAFKKHTGITPTEYRKSL